MRTTRKIKFTLNWWMSAVIEAKLWKHLALKRACSCLFQLCKRENCSKSALVYKKWQNFEKRYKKKRNWEIAMLLQVRLTRIRTSNNAAVWMHIMDKACIASLKPLGWFNALEPIYKMNLLVYIFSSLCVYKWREARPNAPEQIQ